MDFFVYLKINLSPLYSGWKNVEHEHHFNKKYKQNTKADITATLTTYSFIASTEIVLFAVTVTYQIIVA